MVSGTGAVAFAAADAYHATSPDGSTMVIANVHYYEIGPAHLGHVADDGAETEYADVVTARSPATLMTSAGDAGGDRLSDAAGVPTTMMP